MQALSEKSITPPAIALAQTCGCAESVPSRLKVRPAPLAAAFTLVEILVTVALMSFIILGLLMMFSQTQRAFMSSMTQVDVLESGRDVIDMLVNDLANMTPSELPYTLNFYEDTNELCPGPLVQALPGNAVARSNLMQKFYFLTKNNLAWNAIGYQVVPDNNGWVGSLYRFSSNLTPYAASTLTRYFTNGATYNGVYGAPYSFWNQAVFTTSNKLADGIVDFRVRVFATNGFPLAAGQLNVYGYSPAYFRVSGVPLNFGTLPQTNQMVNTTVIPRQAYWPTEPMNCLFWSNAMPAEVEIELGILESKSLKTYQGLGSPAAQLNYLSNHTANVHIFRQRIHLANVDPSAY